MIRVHLDEPRMLVILEALEGALGMRAIAADARQALFDPPANLSQRTMAAIARKARAVLSVVSHDRGEAVRLEHGEMFVVGDAGTWRRISDEDDAPRNIGPCCACGAAGEHSNLYQMPFEAPAGFVGWGCFVCGAPLRGAIAVICDGCHEARREPTSIAGGKHLSDRVRVQLEGYARKPFACDLSKHPEAAHVLH